jgi:type I restriction enzyme S subunit
MIFYKETDFREGTIIGKVPTDWEIVRIEKVCALDRGFLYRSDQVTTHPSKIRFITINDFEKEGGLKRNSESLYLKDETDVDPKYFLDEDEVLVANTDMSRGFIIGAPIYIEKAEGKVAYSMDLTRLIFDKKTVNGKFLFYLLKHEKIRNKMKTFAQGTNVLHLNHELMKKLEIPLPPVEEQRAVAGVLGVVDSVIAKTDEVIAKTERLKKGLMQTLLTRGIGRKEFKETEIGKIPKTWQVVKLREVVLEAKSGFASGKRDENGIFQLRMDSIETEGWINPEAGVKVPIPPDVEEYLLKPGDILFNNTNSVDLIGKTAIFRGELPKCVFSNHLTRIRVDSEKAIPEWILFVLMRKWQIGFFKTICHRHVHQAGINNNDLLNIKIPLPEISEQQKIANILSTADKKLKIEKQEKTRLEKVKHGLMDLLLTGKVRVKVK